VARTTDFDEPFFDKAFGHQQSNFSDSQMLQYVAKYSHLTGCGNGIDPRPK
jgi:hypothetical protein